MIDNTQQISSTPVSVVPSPVISYTKADAERAARMAPVVLRPDHENAIIVASMATPEGILASQCTLIVTHHVQSHRTKKSEVAGSWRIDKVPVARHATELHLFNVAWPAEVPAE